MNPSNHSPNPEKSSPGEGAGVQLPIGALLRAAADGELSAPQQLQLDRHLAGHAADSARVTFEQDLRRACSRVMSSEGVRAPDSLRRAVLAQFEAVPAAPEPVLARIPRVHEGGRVEVPARRWRRVGGLMAAAAAIPLLVAGVLLVLNHESDRGSVAVIPAADRVMQVEFLTKEHCECVTGSLDGLEKVTPEQIPERMRQLVGRPLGIEDLERAGFEFVQMGKCQMPGGGETAHLIFNRQSLKDDGTRREIKLSLFVVNDRNRHRITEGITWQSPRRNKGDGPTIRAWGRDGLIYYLVTECGTSSDLAQQGLEAPETMVMCEPPAEPDPDSLPASAAKTGPAR